MFVLISFSNNNRIEISSYYCSLFVLIVYNCYWIIWGRHCIRVFVFDIGFLLLLLICYYSYVIGYILLLICYYLYTYMYSYWNKCYNCDCFFYCSCCCSCSCSWYSVTLLVLVLLTHLSTCILIINYCSRILTIVIYLILSYSRITRKQRKERKQDFHSLVLSISHEILERCRFCLKFSYRIFWVRNTLVEVSKKFFFTDDIEILGLSGPCDNVEDNTISKSFCRHGISRRVCQH